LSVTDLPRQTRPTLHRGGVYNIGVGARANTERLVELIYVDDGAERTVQRGIPIAYSTGWVTVHANCAAGVNVVRATRNARVVIEFYAGEHDRQAVGVGGSLRQLNITVAG